MIVRALSNSGETIPKSNRSDGVGVNTQTEFAVTLGRDYFVFALTTYLGMLWYYVITDDGHAWPTWTPAALFDIVEGRMPPSWEVAYHRLSGDNQYPVISFPEWAKDLSFYERLVDGEPSAVGVFQKRRKEAEQREEKLE